MLLHHNIPLVLLLLLICVAAHGGLEPVKSITEDLTPTIEQTLKPYTGPVHRGVDTKTLTGKIMCGYQGWFTCYGDESERGWFHWGFTPEGRCNFDFWPDMSEMDPDERYPIHTFKHADGRTAEVFSSYNRKTVVRHFKWMRDYGIDGAFVQRFASQTFEPIPLRHVNTTLSHCREGANTYGRTYAVMYDMNFDSATLKHVTNDWKTLVDKMHLTSDPAYLHHNGKPVIALWGFGFTHRGWDTDAVKHFLKFLKSGKYECTIMLGLPTGWRTLEGDCRTDKVILDLIMKADIVSPWTVGRYGTPEGAAKHATARWAPDMEWCRKLGKDYLPVVFPGFSWHNMHGGQRPLNQIPRLGGQFLWKQFFEAKRLGATMIYQAMFDEVDEGTAIFKCTNDPPVGNFVTYEGLPNNYYLWLVGEGGRLIRDEIELTEDMPKCDIVERLKEK